MGYTIARERSQSDGNVTTIVASCAASTPMTVTMTVYESSCPDQLGPHVSLRRRHREEDPHREEDHRRRGRFR
jgi:hypothetical protein